MSPAVRDPADELATAGRLVRRCLWLAALNLALVTLCAARVYELI